MADSKPCVNVLVVRSQSTSHRSLKGFLTRAGFTVVETTNGHDTIAALPSVESIVIDLLMENPTVEDVKVVRKIRDSGCLIPIVVVGRGENAAIREEIESDDLVQYLCKPTDYLRIEKEILDGVEAHKNIKELESLTGDALESMEAFVKWTGEMAVKDKLAGACV